MTELTLSGMGVLYTILAIVSGVVVVTFALKTWYAKLSKDRREQNEQDQHLPKGIKSRNKYQELDVFAISKPIWIFGLGTAMFLSLCAFSWASSAKEVFIPIGAADLDIEVEVLRTKPPKPKLPPPPPPPVEIKEVEEELVEDEPVFESMDIDASTEIEEYEPEIEEEPAPPPPAPPPPVEEEPDFFVVAEEMPRFPGCEDIDGTKEEKAACAEQKMLEFIYANVQYPAIARENGIEGRAILQFIVDASGNITKTNIVRDLPGGCGTEAFRVVNKMPQWTPGKQRGRSVSVLYTLPVVFKLRD